MRARARRRVVIGRTAAQELGQALDDIEARSTGGATQVLEEIDACIKRLARFPASSPVDSFAPAMPFGTQAKGRKTHAAGFTVRYAFPVWFEGDAEVVLILSVRHGRRRPLGDPAYLRRFLAELVRGRREPPAPAPAPRPRKRRRV